MSATSEPLTLGTAGHVDHGKTTLVAALTGVNTDHLPEEKARGLTIELGFAPLYLPSGRQLSLIDVPGHERFVRTMVAGATGIDLFLMAVAADDGVMPQTLEHAAVLQALDVRRGVVAVTKADLADPSDAVAQASELLPGCPVVVCASPAAVGLGELARSLERVAAATPSRATTKGAARLHVDRVFTVAGRGTVVTGTLCSGTVEQGAELELLPAGARVRVRGIEVHRAAVAVAHAGQRVAINLTGAKLRELARGDALAAPGTLRETTILDCALVLTDARHGERVQIHHGTRAVSGRLAALDEQGQLWQLRLERPLLALADDRLVVRRLAPPDTLGGGVVLDARARRRGRHTQWLRRRGTEGGVSCVAAVVSKQLPGRAGQSPQPSVDDATVDALELRLREAGAALLSEAQMEGEVDALRELRRAGRAVRVSGRLYAHADTVADVRSRILALIEREGPVALPRVRDALGFSRKSAQAFLEHLDDARLTRRLPDDRRELLPDATRKVAR
jgi:selenocysteine-specific elongation factor